MTRAFAFLIAVQAIHSIEEYWNELYAVLPPAAFVSGLFSANLETGFIIANCLLVAFGLWCWWVPIRKARPSGRLFAYGWGFVETANGIGHIGLTVATRGYFPGFATAPLLLIASAWLFLKLGKHEHS